MKKKYLISILLAAACSFFLMGCTKEEEKKVQAPLDNANSLLEKYTEETKATTASGNSNSGISDEDVIASENQLVDNGVSNAGTTTNTGQIQPNTNPPANSQEETTTMQEVTTTAPKKGMTWKLENGILTISGKGEMDDIPWFSERTSIKKIIIENGITSIRKAAFDGCSNLTSITIPSSVTSIGYKAFHDCGSLTNIDIPSGVKSIGAYAFYGCRSLTNIVIPSNITTIESYTFYDCSGLLTVTMPASVTSISSDAFTNAFPTFYGPGGSYAETYALQQNFAFVAR